MAVDVVVHPARGDREEVRGSPRACAVASVGIGVASSRRRARRALAEHPLVEQLDPVAHRRCVPPARCVRQPMLAVAMTSGRAASSACSLLRLELRRELGLQHRIGARRAAAQVRVGDRQELEWPIASRISSTCAADAACRAAACTANGTRRAAGRGPSRSAARSSSTRRRRPRPGRARAPRSASPCPRTPRRARAGGRSPSPSRRSRSP